MTYAEKIKQKQERELARLLEYFGTLTHLAHELGTSPQTCFNWLARKKISKAGAIKAQQVTNGKFKKEQLRPDVITWEK